MAQSTQSPRRCGRGSGNPWTPSTVPDQMPVRSPVTVAPLPTDSTYSMTEFLQQHSAVNSGSSAETPASADVDGAANVGSIADSRLALPDLSTDLLHNVFIRLAPNPKDLAPLEAVCR